MEEDILAMQREYKRKEDLSGKKTQGARGEQCEEKGEGNRKERKEVG